MVDLSQPMKLARVRYPRCGTRNKVLRWERKSKWGVIGAVVTGRVYLEPSVAFLCETPCPLCGGLLPPNVKSSTREDTEVHRGTPQRNANCLKPSLLEPINQNSITNACRVTRACG